MITGVGNVVRLARLGRDEVILRPVISLWRRGWFAQVEGCGLNSWPYRGRNRSPRLSPGAFFGPWLPCHRLLVQKSYRTVTCRRCSLPRSKIFPHFWQRFSALTQPAQRLPLRLLLQRVLYSDEREVVGVISQTSIAWYCVSFWTLEGGASLVFLVASSSPVQVGLVCYDNPLLSYLS